MWGWGCDETSLLSKPVATHMQGHAKFTCIRYPYYRCLAVQYSYSLFEKFRTGRCLTYSFAICAFGRKCEVTRRLLRVLPIVFTAKVLYSALSPLIDSNDKVLWMRLFVCSSRMRGICNNEIVNMVSSAEIANFVVIHHAHLKIVLYMNQDTETQSISVFAIPVKLLVRSAIVVVAC